MSDTILPCFLYWSKFSLLPFVALLTLLVHLTSADSSGDVAVTLPEMPVFDYTTLSPSARLEQYLFGNYSTIARPVRQSSQAVVVEFDFILNQILKVNEQEQKVTTAVWNVRKWNDEFLSWSPEEFGNISDIRIRKDRIWYPDLVVTNTIQVQEPEIKIKLQHNGDIMWDSALVLETSCHINVKFFPYDHQFCQILIGSWTFPQKELDLINSSDSGVIDYYVENDAWELQGVSVHRSVNNYPGYDSPLVDLCYLIHLKRRPRFFELNVILPCALLSVVVIAVFCLPCECGEKITLSITILLALAVNNVMISEKMPPSSKNAPILGDYFLAQVSLVMASVFASVLVLTIHHKGTRRKPIPPSIRQLAFEKLAKYFCLQNSLTSIRRKTRWSPRDQTILMANGSAMHNGSRIPTCNDSSSTTKYTRTDPKAEQNSLKFPLISGHPYDVQQHPNSTDTHQRNTTRIVNKQVNKDDDVSNCDQISEDMEKMKKSLIQIRNFIRQHEQEIENETEWKELAMVIDRLFALIFFITSSMVSIIFMLIMYFGAEFQLIDVMARPGCEH